MMSNFRTLTKTQAYYRLELIVGKRPTGTWCDACNAKDRKEGLQAALKSIDWEASQMGRAINNLAKG